MQIDLKPTKLKSFIILGILLCVIVLGFNLKRIKLGHHDEVIYPRLLLPSTTVLLDRSGILQQIEDLFKQQTSEIRSVILVGPGGAGKTTVAHLYGQTQQFTLVWELNAESSDSLIDSCNDLAFTLARTIEQKQQLVLIQNIQDAATKKKAIINFVKRLLKGLPNWLLIYDNVENFIEIKHYLPQDTNSWGNGKVIVTTRDLNVTNKDYMKDANELILGELKEEESLTLFCNILYNNKHDKLPAVEKVHIKELLKNIPSFPLDISVAAHYIKRSNISFEEYIARLNQFSADFDNLQESLLKEECFYSKTRYKIILLTIEKIINKNEEFKDLLLLISFLDYRNIPRDLLEKFKPKIVIDSFIHFLKKYSLITDEFILSSKESSFSVHSNVQAINFTYFNSKFSLNQNKDVIKKIEIFIENYVNNLIAEENILKMKEFVNHYEKYLDSERIWEKFERGLSEINLGCIYYFLGDYSKSRKYLEGNVNITNESSTVNKSKMAKAMVYLGNIYWELCLFDKSKKVLEESYFIYKNFLPDDYLGVIKCLSNLGNVCRELGEFKKARDILEKNLIMCRKYLPETSSELGLNLIYLGNVHRELEQFELAKDFLEQSITIYNTYGSNNHLRIAWALAQMGNVYKVLGEYEKAKESLEKSLAIYENVMCEHVGKAWALTYLGNVYRKLGQQKKAINLIEQSLVIYRKHFPENHFRVSYAIFYLAEVYREFGDSEKAKGILETHLTSYKNQYGESNFQVAQILKSLGQIYLFKDQTDIAEKYLLNSLSLLQKRKKPSEIYIILENLGDLYIKKSQDPKQINNKQYKAKAYDYLRQSLKIMGKNSQENSSDFKRVKDKINKIKEL